MLLFLRNAFLNEPKECKTHGKAPELRSNVGYRSATELVACSKKKMGQS